MPKTLSKPWTIYLARPLSKVPNWVESWLTPQFERLKMLLRAEGYLIYDFIGLNPDDPELVSDEDLTRVELADLVLSIHCEWPSEGVGGEVLWKCARKEPVISCAKRGVYVSSLIRGMKVRNPHFQFLQFDDVAELIPIVNAHFNARIDEPKLAGPHAPPLQQFEDPATRQPLFRQKKMPVPT